MNDYPENIKDLPDHPMHLDMLINAIKSGTNINNQDVYGNTALHYAARSKNFDRVKYLIELGANVNVINRFGYTPAFYALSSKNIHMIQYLLDSGVDKNHIDDDGFTIRDIAAMRHYDDVVHFIESYEPVPTKGVNS
jgi:ankyrin repeat protein